MSVKPRSFDDRLASPKALREVADELFATINDGDVRQRLETMMALERVWTSMVGVIAAKNVRIACLRRDGVLVVQASSAVWMQEITCLKHQILAKLKFFPGCEGLHDIKVRIAGFPRPKTPPSEQFTGNDDIERLSENERERIAAIVTSVHDPALKCALTRLFERSRTHCLHAKRRNSP